MRNLKLATLVRTAAALAAMLLCVPVGVYALTPSGAQISASSSATYRNSAGSPMPASTSNTVIVTVAQIAKAAIEPMNGNATVSPGATGRVAVTIRNIGNGTDNFNLTCAANNAWSASIIRDDNGDGVWQPTETTVLGATPAIQPDSTCKFFVGVTVPAGAQGGSSGVAGLTAASSCDPTMQVRGAYTYTVATAAATSEYIRQWLVNGYYTNSDSKTRLTKDYLGNEADAVPYEGMSQGGATWALMQMQSDTLDFKSIYGSTVQSCAAYTCAYVYSPTDQPAGLWVGSDDGVKVWLNGTCVWLNNVSRRCVPNQDKIPIDLLAGWNRLLVKVSQGSGAWALVAKVCDSDGRPLPAVYTATDTGDTTPPTIMEVSQQVSGTSMVVTWTTEEPSSSLIEYETPSLTLYVGSPELVRNHAVRVPDLTPNTTYRFKVISHDASGNGGEDGVFEVSTTDSEPTPYISEWLINAFYYHPERSTRMAADYLGGEATVHPVIGQFNGPVPWIPLTARYDGYLDLAAAYGNTALEGIGYAHVWIYSPANQRAILALGSDDGLKVYLNSTCVWFHDTYRRWNADRDTTIVTLLEGWNSLLIKTTQGLGKWGISARFCDEQGYPLPGVYSDIGTE